MITTLLSKAKSLVLNEHRYKYIFFKKKAFVTNMIIYYQIQTQICSTILCVLSR